MPMIVQWTGPQSTPDEGRVVRLQIGPLSVLVGRDAREWRFGTRYAEDPLMAQVLSAEASDEELEACTWSLRYPVRGTALGLQPALADRDVIAVPESSLAIPADESVTVYVSSPLWVRVHVDEKQVFETPTFRPSDTWFGASPTDGELCYASRTRALLDPDKLLILPTRALTEATMTNRTGEVVKLAHVRVPVPHMRLYRAHNGSLWTQAVTMTLEEATTSPTRVEEAPPAVAGEVEVVAEARVVGTGLARTLGALFSLV